MCVFSELRNRLRAGDVWVDRSRQYQDFETYVIPKLTFEMLKAEGPLPVEIETEVQRYLESRRSALTQELATVELTCTKRSALLARDRSPERQATSIRCFR